jgi:hypothetical protein
MIRGGVEAVRILKIQVTKPPFPSGQICAKDRMECSSLGTLFDWLDSEELRQEFKKMDCNRKNPKPLSAIGQICAQHRMVCSQRLWLIGLPKRNCVGRY